MAQKDLVNRAQMTLTLDKKVIEFLKSYSNESGIPISRYIDKLVLEQMKQEPEKSVEN